MQTLKIAGLTFDFTSRLISGEDEPLLSYAVPKNSDSKPAFTLNPEPWIDMITDETDQGPASVEFYAISVALGERLPLTRRLQTHGVAIAYEGKSYIFTAPSGTGKSTRAFLWQKYIGEDKVRVINGDKPILWFRDDCVLACGSPWAGKEGLHLNLCLPLGGICLLKRSPENVIRKAGSQEFFDFYVNQVQMPKDSTAMLDALSLIDELYRRVPVFILENDMSEQGVKVCYEALTGKEYIK